ncbi:hypothetical protein FIBSPDRAFT_830231 [Athelia psychrophila]|uniref:Golgi apparatus membrane protein TVP38 n=1 Tax=Athelia psychrophila TaxID=1759441 RepID=A0A166GBP8_9AGAM|nr:hypothetical protein FIBSPDRAFT_830231 [Fibularhizoctonia sp. CBS 109695]
MSYIPPYSYASPQEPAPVHSNEDQEHYEPGPLHNPYEEDTERQEPHAPQPQHYNPYGGNQGRQESSFDPNTLAPQYQYGGLESERGLARTPSPTQSETEALEEKKLFNWRKTFNLKRENWPRLAIITVILVLVIIFSVEEKKIIRALQPAANWCHDTKGGFLVPIALLIILSQPPLFGAEIVAMLCGVVWGAGYGFLVAIIGQFLGELLNFFLFKYLCKARSDKMRKSSIKYEALARIFEDGGLLVAVVARYSIIPSHLVTAIFATCGMKLWIFCVSALLSMPQNFVNVYLGSYFEAQEKGTDSAAGNAVNYVTIAITVVVTIAAARYMDKQINKAKPAIVRARQKAR